MAFVFECVHAPFFSLTLLVIAPLTSRAFFGSAVRRYARRNSVPYASQSGLMHEGPTLDSEQSNGHQRRLPQLHIQTQLALLNLQIQTLGRLRLRERITRSWRAKMLHGVCSHNPHSQPPTYLPSPALSQPRMLAMDRCLPLHF